MVKFVNLKITTFVFLSIFTEAPLASPRNLKVIKKTASTIELSWDSVPLRDRPRIYIVTVTGEITKTKNVQTGFGARIVKTTIDNLLPNRKYTITIKAVNVVGTGPTSEELVTATEKLTTGKLSLIGT